MKTFHTGWAIDSYIAQRTIGGFLRVKSSYFSVATFVLLNPLTLIAVIFGVWAWWKSGPSSLNVIMTALAILIVGASSSVWLLPHYLAPGLPLLLNLAIHGLRHFRIYLSQTRGQHSRIFNGLALAYVVFFAAQCAYCAVAKDHSWSYERERIADNLARQEGQHLVFVQYGPHHSPHDEWVYNKAEIDAASVVWARDLGAEANDRLMQYFSGRKIWKIAVDSTPAHLIPVERAGITQSAAVGTSEL